MRRLPFQFALFTATVAAVLLMAPGTIVAQSSIPADDLSIDGASDLFAPPPLPGGELPLPELIEPELIEAEQPLPAPRSDASSATTTTDTTQPPIARLRPHKDNPFGITPANLRKQPHELPAPQEEVDAVDPLPSLDEELWLHGGSYLYAPEGDRLNWPHDDPHAHYRLLRLPEEWHAPQPITLFNSFLGTGPIAHGPQLRWPRCGYHWDPRLVLYGSYEIIGAALEENNQRHDVLGHQLLVDLDFRLTGTERAHIQWRPLGERNTGGSFYQFSNPEGYVDNSTGIPDRYWVEWELASVLGGYFDDQFIPRDYHTVVGKFPFAAHNQLLINDDILGFAVNKNTIYLGTLSNLNIQAVVALDDVEAFSDGSANLYLLNTSADHRHTFVEATYAYVQHGRLNGRDAQYAALSATKHCGLSTLAGRALFRIAPAASGGGGELFVLEYNRPHVYDPNCFGVEKSVFYATAFRSTKGWQSISGGNFDRVRTAFAVDPLIPLSAARSPEDNVGVALGVQFFRHEEDESLLPELAYDAPGGDSVWGIGLRYQRKTGPRTFFELQAIANWSDNFAFRREGVFLSETIVF